MAGIYIHIPFCKQACHYCDFHFSTNLAIKKDFIDALVKEIKMAKEYIIGKNLETIYVGGGTPSILEISELTQIFKALEDHYSISDIQEITLEANPDDLNIEKLLAYKKLGINRLSIGIQSFNDGHLNFTNRNHTSFQATQCVKEAQKAGFDNISIDLIYGIPSRNHDIWKKDLELALALEVQHISAYCLTIEPKTVFGNWKASQKMTFATDDFEAEQFEFLLNTLSKYGFEQYEISNFCKNEQYAKHNTNYWQNKHYLGLGPSAHSFNGLERRWNISNNKKYVESINLGIIPFESEILTDKDKANEYIMISLRTKWGLNLARLSGKLGVDIKILESSLKMLEKKRLINIDNGIVHLTDQGKLLGDDVSSELFI